MLCLASRVRGHLPTTFYPLARCQILRPPLGLAHFATKIKQPKEESIPSDQTKSSPDYIAQRKRLYYLKNKEALQKSRSAWYQENKEAILARSRAAYHVNREAERERSKIYYQKNKEAERNKAQIYYLKNKEKIDERNKRYKKENKEAVQNQAQLYYQQNKEALIEKSKAYYQENREEPTLKSWKTPDEVRQTLDEIAKKLVIKGPNDWYRVSTEQIKNAGGGRIFSSPNHGTGFGGLYKALQFGYPEIEWDEASLSTRNKRAAQRWLFVQVKRLIPEKTEIHEEFEHSGLKWSQSLRNVEFDIWIPELKLALGTSPLAQAAIHGPTQLLTNQTHFHLEYQGEQHYYDNFPAFGPTGDSAAYKERDLEKQRLSQEAGITLVQVPYWWDGTMETLQATLHLVRPELFGESHAAPIPLEPPEESTNKMSNSWRVAFLMHGVDYVHKDPTDWIMSEKIDGIRAIWTRNQLLTRQGNPIHVPPGFVSSLPRDICLDGELSCGYNTWRQLHSIMLRAAKNADPELWAPVSYRVFDAPEHDAPYPERHAYASSHITPSNQLSVIPIQTCKGSEHLQSELVTITKAGGEGIMLHHPTAKYEAGRVQSLQKVKYWQEAKVKFIQRRTKSYTFLCKQEDGIQCAIKVLAYDYRNPPPVGTELTAKYSGVYLKSKKLKNASLVHSESASWKAAAIQKKLADGPAISELGFPTKQS